MSIRSVSFFIAVFSAAFGSLNAQAQEKIPPTKKILAPINSWERNQIGAQYVTWERGLKAGGYSVEYVSQDEKAPELTARQMLDGYDAVAISSRSTFLENSPKFMKALEDYVRQGGGLIFLVSHTGDAGVGPNLNFLLPVNASIAGTGWSMGTVNKRVGFLPGENHPINAGIDWKSAPALQSINTTTSAPTNEIWRGSLQVIGPREGLMKPLLNTNWQEIAHTADFEHSPALMVGQYGRGRIVVWNAFYDAEPYILGWTSLDKLWQNVAAWIAEPGKIAAAQPAVWVAGANNDGNIYNADINIEEYRDGVAEFHRVLSYIFPDVGLSYASTAGDAQGALVLHYNEADKDGIVALARAGKPLLITDTNALPVLGDLSPLSTETAPLPTRKVMTLGEDIAVLRPAAPEPKKDEKLTAQPITDANLAPPRQWKIRATNSVTFTRDMQEKWFAPGYDDKAWPSQAIANATQKINGKDAPVTGAIWYRAAVDLPNTLPENAVWSFDMGEAAGLYGYKFRAWVDGKEIPADTYAENMQYDRGPWVIRLADIGAGAHTVAIRFYNSGGGNYWTGSRLAMANFGLAHAVAQIRPRYTPKAFDDEHTKIPVNIRRVDTKLYPNEPVLFYNRATGDKDFKIPFTLEADAVTNSPVLVFDDPGLILRVRVNGTWIDRVPCGAWNGGFINTDFHGNMALFPLKGVLKAGENVLEFHPDFDQQRGIDVPLPPSEMMPCSLPRISWTSLWQTLEAVDPVLAPYIPNRPFMPGETLLPAPGTVVLLRWNDGRPALVRKNNVMAWTSTKQDKGHQLPAQFNTGHATTHNRWMGSWENSYPWDYSLNRIPRTDAMLWENTSPLLGVLLSRAYDANAVRFAAVNGVSPRAGVERSVEAVVQNPGAAREAQLFYRVQDWQGAIIANKVVPVSLKAGENRLTIPVPASPFEGGNWKPEIEVRASIRSQDGTVGLAEIEKVLTLSPPVRIAIQNDDVVEMALAGRIPEKLKDNPNFRGRDMWWPVLDRDNGTFVYLSGDNANVRVALTNQTDEAQTVPVTLELTAPGKDKVEKTVKDTVTIPPRGKKVVTLQSPVAGSFEPYRIQVQAAGQEVAKPVYALTPQKKSFHVDRVPIGAGMSFGESEPLHGIQQPDNVDVLKQQEEYRHGTWTSGLHDWYVTNRSGSVGNGGGINGATGYVEDFGWGPFFRARPEQAGYMGLGSPDQIGVLPDGRPFMHYVAEGLQRQQRAPARNEVIDFWVNYSIFFNWNSLPAFREWLAFKYPEKAKTFTPQTLEEAKKMVRETLNNEWDEWQQYAVIGGWAAVREAAPTPNTFWNQSEHAILGAYGVSSASEAKVSKWGPREFGGTDATEIVKFMAKLYTTADADSGTTRMGLGYRYRSFNEASTAALAPDVHFNVQSGRHRYWHNEQRLSNRGNVTVETYRPFMFETAWAASVKPDGSLRAAVDTPPSEPFPWSSSNDPGLQYGDTVFSQFYSLTYLMEPQKAIGLLWVAYQPRDREGDAQNSRVLYEIARNGGAPISAIISPEYLRAAPKSGASGLVYLLPPRLRADEVAALNELVKAKFPVVCLAPLQSQQAKTQLPAGVAVIDLPAAWTTRNLMDEGLTWTLDEALGLGKRIQDAAGRVLEVGEGAGVYGFQSQGKSFVIAQNYWPNARDIEVTVDAKTAGVAGAVRAVNLNDNTPLKATVQDGKVKITVPVEQWGAAMVMISNL